jgi:2-polyprenyl-6-methoxyphenol hydroxylase-like FAD-dependent oxidoreductase
MNTANQKKVLISGASFAGLSTAYWMNNLGYSVTVVEIASGLKHGGTPVNIMERTIAIAERMGLLEQIIANQLHMQSMEFRDADDVVQRVGYRQHNDENVEVEYEVERDFLLQLLYDKVKDHTTFIFGETITGLKESGDLMEVNFKNGSTDTYDLVFGCDGIHSTVRKHWFGEEAEFTRFLNTYFSITITDQLLIPENTTQMYSEPGKTVMLNAYNGKTDICLTYYAEQEVPYNYRDEQQMRQLIMDQFQGTGWRTPQLLELVKQSSSFYFDKLCQVKMPSWTKGKVALVGDAGYCPSPAAGRGGSVAIDGAAALADAFEKHNGDYELAFQEYNTSFRPFIEEIQAGVVEYGLDVLIPRTQEAILQRYKEGFGF